MLAMAQPSPTPKIEMIHAVELPAPPATCSSSASDIALCLAVAASRCAIRLGALTSKPLAAAALAITAAALVAQLQSCTDAASSAAVIAKAAAAEGVEVSASDLVTHFEVAIAKQGSISFVFVAQ